MGYTIVTDIFCDKCYDWISGVSGNKVNKYEAWKKAKNCGWTKYNGIFLCPLCNGKALMRISDGTYVMKKII